MTSTGWKTCTWATRKTGRQCSTATSTAGSPVPEGIDLPDNQQDRDMIARELLIKFQMSPRHPMVTLRSHYGKPKA